MALIPKQGFLRSLIPLLQCKRYRGKVNVQRPKPPHFTRATFLELAKPWYISPHKGKPAAELCGFMKTKDKDAEDHPFKRILAKELHSKFVNSKLIVFYHQNSMKADEMFRYYAMFKKQNMELKQYGKGVMQLALTGTPYETVLDFYLTPNNIILFSPEVEIHKVMKITKKCPRLVLLTGIVENNLLSKDDLDKFSKIPNIQAAQSHLVQTINSVGSQLVSNLNVHQTGLTTCLENRIKQLQE